MIPKIIRRAEIEEQLGLARSTIYQMVADGEFPKPVKLGRRAVGWRAEEVESWFLKMQEPSND